MSTDPNRELQNFLAANDSPKVPPQTPTTKPTSSSSATGKTVGGLSIAAVILIAMVSRIPRALKRLDAEQERPQHYSAPQQPVISDTELAEMEQAVHDGKAGSAIQRLMGKQPAEKNK